MAITARKMSNALSAGRWIKELQTQVAAMQTTGAGAPAAAGATLAVTALAHNGKVVKLDTLAGSVATLPAATGSGMKVKFLVSVLTTSNSHKVQVANAQDFIIGAVAGVSDNAAAVLGWIAANSGTVATNSDTITLNKTTTGGVSVGDWVELTDVAANTWAVHGLLTQSGTEATPFSAAV